MLIHLLSCDEQAIIIHKLKKHRVFIFRKCRHRRHRNFNADQSILAPGPLDPELKNVQSSFYIPSSLLAAYAKLHTLEKLCKILVLFVGLRAFGCGLSKF